MTIEFLERNSEFGENIDFVPLIENGQIHYVSVAMPGLTQVSALIQFAGGFDVMQRNDFMLSVNHAREAGTLYPKINVTLLPSPTASYSGLDSNTYNDGDYSEKEVVTHICDAFKANSEYIKSDTMYFDFRNLSVSESLYVSCLQMAVLHKIRKDKLPKNIITWNPPLM